jgi:hypothetical protein
MLHGDSGNVMSAAFHAIIIDDYTIIRRRPIFLAVFNVAKFGIVCTMLTVKICTHIL